MFRTILCLILSIGLSLCTARGQSRANPPSGRTAAEIAVDFVNPFIGTGGHGHTFPGATTPFGMVQLSPDTDNKNWDWCSGYHYSDSSVMGFSHTHLSGTGASDLGDVLVMPMVGEVRYRAGDKDKPDSGWRSRFSHDREGAEAGYYWVLLKDYGIKAELTATPNAGFHRYTFPKSDQSHILIDLYHKIHGEDVKDSEIAIVNDSTVAGYRSTSGWAPLRFVYFYARFSRPFAESRIYTRSGDGKADSRSAPKEMKAGGGMGCVLSFATGNDEAILVKVGISSVSREAAQRALTAEIPHWDFDRIRRETKAVWDGELNKIKIQGSRKTKEIFYTALYHTMIAPNEIADDRGNYIGPDHKVRGADSGMFYSTFSLWDTYRANHPLFTLIHRDRVPGMVGSLLESFKGNGFLPLWTLWGDETNCMIGNHSVPVIVDACLKGIGGIDREVAYRAVRTSLTEDHFFSPWTLYDAMGYLPADLEGQSVSKTLEFCYNDWCAAQMAKALGKTDDYRFFLKRSESYRKLYNPSTGFFRGRNADGSWKTPFNPYAIDWSSYTEATAWQYSWYVPQNVPDMIRLMGGDRRFAAKLDSLFHVSSEIVGQQSDITGLIGQYAHGNEPSHHIAYLYDYARQPWKTQAYVREIMDTQYNNTIDGISGNEDCGQMSAWYVLSAMGFYPVNPCGGVYAIGSPAVDGAVLDTGNGKTFTITVQNQSPANRYIQSATLNGQRLDKSWISHEDILRGGTLVFRMGSKPNRGWASAENSVPPSLPAETGKE
jgi:predicted alpha-1,2-mannosidase